MRLWVLFVMPVILLPVLQNNTRTDSQPASPIEDGSCID